MLKQELIKESIIFVDLDGTLVATDKANNFAYRQAILEILDIDIGISDLRVTAEIAEQLLGGYSEKVAQIIQRKKRLYPMFLSQTSVNQKLLRFLQKSTLTHPIYLVTSSEEKRAKETLYFHHLYPLFTHVFYCKTIKNKYLYATQKLRVNPQNILIFEDDINEIDKAISVNIPKNNIYHIKHLQESTPQPL